MTAHDSVLLDALRAAVERDPTNGPLWAHYGEMLAASGRKQLAADALRKATDLSGGDVRVLQKLVPILRELGQLPEALIRAEAAVEAHNDVDLRLEMARILRLRGDAAAALEQYLLVLHESPQKIDADLERLRTGPVDSDESTSEPVEIPEPDESDDDLALASVNPDRVSPDDLAADFDWNELYTTFQDVVGLDDVKRQIHLRIVAPFKKKEIFKAFSRQGGGGILLYGPPGCGKTFIARATAGECDARFVAVGIHEMVDKYWGESEKLMHALFEDARRKSPAVIFFDEFDALGSARGRGESQFWKTLVDQLLQEMDGVGSRNQDLLVFAATNVPWNVDAAFRRPGRFDRLIFVPPPDAAARVEILRRHVEKLPGGQGIDVKSLAQATELMTGADLKSLCERASESALMRSLETDRIHPVTLDDFRREIRTMQTSAGEWLSTARNYARYSNESGQYDELVAYLKKVKKW